MKKLISLLTIPFIISCSSIKSILPQKEIIITNTIMDTIFVQPKINPLNTLNGMNAYNKAREYYEKAEEEYYSGNDSTSKKYFETGLKLFSQSNLPAENYIFFDPITQMEKLNRHQEYLREKENSINITPEEINEILIKESNSFITKETAERIAYYKKFYKTKHIKWFNKTNEIFHQYEPYIDSLLIEKKLPPIIKYMYPVESAMKKVIYSHAGAAGIAQFIKTTAENYGLTVLGDWYDERLDPTKAIPASLEYLEFINSRLNNINLSIAAYNLGEQGIIRRINRSKTNNLEELINAGILPRETRNHLPKIYAFMELSNETPIIKPEKDFYLEKLLTNNFDIVTIDKQTSIGLMSRLLNMKKEDFKKLNPAYQMHATPPPYMVNGQYKFEIRIPKDQKENFLNKLSKVKKRIDDATIFYRVKRGDTLGKLARKYKTSTRTLMRLNKITDPKTLREGKRIIIPTY